MDIMYTLLYQFDSALQNETHYRIGTLFNSAKRRLPDDEQDLLTLQNNVSRFLVYVAQYLVLHVNLYSVVCLPIELLQIRTRV